MMHVTSSATAEEMLQIGDIIAFVLQLDCRRRIQDLMV